MQIYYYLPICAYTSFLRHQKRTIGLFFGFFFFKACSFFIYVIKCQRVGLRIRIELESDSTNNFGGNKLLTLLKLSFMYFL